MQQLQKLFLMLLLISITTSSFAQNENRFTIHVGAFVNSNIQDFANIRNIGYIYADKMPNNLLQIYLGEFQSESAANQTLLTIHAKGYPDAYVTRRTLSDQQEEHFIQIETKLVQDDINWQEYIKAGPLYAVLHNNAVKLVTGPFMHTQEAEQRLVALRNMGFKDAFVKKVNKMRLHRVGNFETGGPITAPSVVAFNEAKVIIPTAIPVNKDVPTSYEERSNVPSDIPTSYGDDVLTAKSPNVSPPMGEPVMIEKPLESFRPASKLGMPTIRKNVKRKSALELQKILKVKGTYKGSIDGLYGNGTSAAYLQAKNDSKPYQKYFLLSKMANEFTEKAPANITQHYISNLPNNPEAAIQGLTGSKVPIAKAYRAYKIFMAESNRQKVNSLMNRAIQESFAGKTNHGLPFDPEATYSYENVSQVIQHIAFIHSVDKEKIKVPCWLFERHPIETSRAFDKAKNYDIELCDKFDNWEEIKVLKTVAMDMDKGLKSKESLINASNAKRAKLFLSPSKLSDDERRWMLQWDAVFWEGINEWSAKDPVHSKMVEALKLSYFQSQVLLEDFFMDKDFKATEAKALSLSVLQTIVQPYLDGYILKG